MPRRRRGQCPHAFGEELLIVEKGVDRSDQFVSSVCFQHVPVRAGFDDFRHDLIGFVHAQDEDLRGHGTANLPDDFQAVQLRHADVEHHDVGLKDDGLGHGVAPRTRLATHDPSSLPFQHRAHTVPDELMIVGDKDADWCHWPILFNGTLTRTVVPFFVNWMSKVPFN
jgi:hypothetical protein